MSDFERLEALATQYEDELTHNEGRLIEALHIDGDLDAAGLNGIDELVAFVVLLLERHPDDHPIVGQLGAGPLYLFMGAELLDAIQALPKGVSKAFRRALAFTRPEFESPEVKVRIERLLDTDARNFATQ